MKTTLSFLLMPALLPQLAAGADVDSPFQLFYCPTMVAEDEDGSGQGLYEYKFKWQLTRQAGVENPHIWEIIVGDRARSGEIGNPAPADAIDLGNLQSIDGEDLPFQLGRVNQVLSAQHAGALISIDPKYVTAMENQQKSLEELGQNFRRVLFEGFEDVGAGSCQIVNLGNVVEFKGMENLIRFSRAEEIMEHYCFINGEVGWYPKFVGDSVSWTARADRYDPNLTLYWTFLNGNVDGEDEHLEAILDCSNHQDLTMDYVNHKLSLTKSESVVDLYDLVNDHGNELQDLQLNKHKLSLTKSDSTVDLSHLVGELQDLTWNEETMELGMSGLPNNTVDLSSLAPDLQFDSDTNTLQVSDAGQKADLSVLRVVTLQAALENVNGKKDQRRRLGQEDNNNNNIPPARELGGNNDKGIVTYAGSATSGWTLISDGNIIGISITANMPVKEGVVEIEVVDCTNKDAPSRLAPGQALELSDVSGSRSATLKFSPPIRVFAGSMICLQVSRDEEVKSEEKDNPASLLLMLEQE